jgi:hypothetical protein
MSRRVVLVGACRGFWMGAKGSLAATDGIIDALLEARYRQPRGHYLRLYRAGTWPERLTKGETS